MRTPQAANKKTARVTPTDEPNEEEREIHEALEQWGRWTRSSPSRSRAMSAEGAYNARAGDTYEPPEPREYFDELRCEAVNVALLDLPKMSRKALILRYFSRYPDPAICRRIGLAPTFYQSFMRHARAMVKARAFTFAPDRLIVPLDNSTPSTTDECMEPRGGASYTPMEPRCQPWQSAPAPFQVAARSRMAAGAIGIAKQTAPAGASGNKAPSLTHARPGGGFGSTSYAPARPASPARRKAE